MQTLFRLNSWTRNPEDAQKTFDLLASKEKELFWIENTTRRFKDHSRAASPTEYEID